MARGDGIKFFRRFLTHPTSIGAVAPSSAALARAMVKDLQVAPGQTVVEFGPGTGPFTAALQGVLADPRCYLGVERDPQFVLLLRQRYPDMAIEEGSAELTPRYLEKRGCGPVRAVVCGLPFASLPPRVQDAVIEALNVMLLPASEFRTFQYMHAYPLPTAVRFRRRMNALFGPCRIQARVLGNIPPALVLCWKRQAVPLRATSTVGEC